MYKKGQLRAGNIERSQIFPWKVMRRNFVDIVRSDFLCYPPNHWQRSTSPANNVPGACVDVGVVVFVTLFVWCSCVASTWVSCEDGGLFWRRKKRMHVIDCKLTGVGRKTHNRNVEGGALFCKFYDTNQKVKNSDLCFKWTEKKGRRKDSNKVWMQVSQHLQ